MAKSKTKRQPKQSAPPKEGQSAPLSLQVEIVAIDLPVLDENNARTHGARNLEAIKGSLLQFGQQKPIVLRKSDNVVIAGNGTLLGARELGWTEIAVIYSTLDDLQALSYAIADNRTGELADWDFETLAEHIRALVDNGDDLAILGWEPHELEPLLQADWNPPPLGDLPEGSDASKAAPIAVTPDQRKIIDEAIARVRESESDHQMAEGRCLELICADFLAKV